MLKSRRVFPICTIFPLESFSSRLGKRRTLALPLFRKRPSYSPPSLPSCIVCLIREPSSQSLELLQERQAFACAIFDACKSAAREAKKQTKVHEFLKMEPKGVQTADNDGLQRIEWVKMMRRKFSPPDMLLADGEINQDFFKPTKVVLLDNKRWGSEESELLLQGIEKYGIGKWRDIGEEFLPRWDDQALRVKAARLMGSQSLARYVSWKGDRAAVEQEYERNKELGKSIGCWKSGMLVEDDDGRVKQALQGLS